MESNPVLLQDLRNKINKIHTLFAKHHVESVEELIEIAHNLESNQQNFLELEKQIAAAKESLIKTEKTKAPQFCGALVII